QSFRSARCRPVPQAADRGEKIPLRYGIRRGRFSEQEVDKTPDRVPKRSEANPERPWRPQRYRGARKAQPRNVGWAVRRKSQAAARTRFRRRLGIRPGGGTDREAHQGCCAGSRRFQSRQAILEMMRESPNATDPYPSASHPKRSRITSTARSAIQRAKSRLAWD